MEKALEQVKEQLEVEVLLLLLMAIVYAKRKAWVIQPLSRLVVGLFIHDEEEEEATL